MSSWETTSSMYLPNLHDLPDLMAMSVQDTQLPADIAYPTW